MLKIFSIYNGFALFQFFFTYFFSSIVVFQVIASFLRVTKVEALKIFVYCLGIGPITIAIFLALLLWLFPNHPDRFYLLSIESIFLLCAIIYIKQWKLLLQIGQEIISNASAFKSSSWLVISLYSLALVAFILIFIQATVAPFAVDADAMEYATVARLVYATKTIAFYPIVSTGGYGGLITSWTHPPLYIATLVWGYLSQGFSTEPGLIKFITPMYCWYTLILLWQILSNKSKLASALGMILLVTTPIYYKEVTLHGIDTIRLYALLLAFNFLADFLSRPSYRYATIMGCLVGICLLSHSSGIIALPIFSFIYLIFSDELLKDRILKIITVGMLGIIFVLPSYIVNIHTYGALIQDSSPVWQVKQMDFDSTSNAIRGIATLGQQWIYGVLAGLSKTDIFGISYWILIGGLLYLIMGRVKVVSFFTNNNLIDKAYLYKIWIIPVIVVLLFYIMVILTVLNGQNIVIKNTRYLMTVQPFIVIIAAAIMASLYEIVSRKIDFCHQKRLSKNYY